MDRVIAARAQMGTSLSFHIVFAALGVGLPLLVFIAEGAWLRTNDRAYYELARNWAKGMGILFAVGAVSGTIVAFQLGLLWPGFMRYAGGIIGMPFSLEGFAFFIEAIFIGVYLYGWDRLSPRAHWLALIPVIVSGAASAAFVTLANAWMQMPTGFRMVDGHPVDVHPFVAMFPLSWRIEVLHATIAGYVFTGFATAAVCAWAWLRGDRRPTVVAGLRVAAIVAACAIPVATRVRRRERALRRGAPAGEVRGDGGRPPHRARRAVHHRRYPDGRRHPLRDRDPLAAEFSGRLQRADGDRRARRGRAARPAAGRPDAPVVRCDGGFRDAAARHRRVLARSRSGAGARRRRLRYARCCSAARSRSSRWRRAGS